jgi:hypothetical protein
MVLLNLKKNVGRKVWKWVKKKKKKKKNKTKKLINKKSLTVTPFF